MLLIPFDEFRFAGRGLEAAIKVSQRGQKFDFSIVNDVIKFSNPKRAPTEGWVDFVIMQSGELRLGNGHYFLSDEAERVFSAGEIYLTRDGKITAVTDHSGHYLPTIENTVEAARVFRKNKIATKDLHVVNKNKK